jgi:predicted PurR-regulated permease PerM
MAELVPIRARSSDEDLPAPPSDARSFARRVWIAVAIVAAFALGALGIWAGRSALLLIYTSLLLATGLLPLIKKIERVVGGRRWSPPRWSVISVVYAVFLGLVSIAALLIVPTLIAQADELSRRLPSMLASWQSGLVKHGWLARPLTIADAVQQTAPATVPPDNAPIAIAASAVRGLAFGVVEIVTALILTFYILIDGPRVGNELARAIPSRHRARVTSVARDVTGRVSGWLQGNLFISAIMGSATALVMGLLGEPYFWVVALVAALAEAVPIAGPILAGLFAVLLALTVSGQLALWVALVFVVLHEVEANVLIPKVMERQVGVSSLAVFVALLIGAEWFGLAGAILAIPTTAIISAILEELRKPPAEKLAAAQQRR